MPKEKTKPRVTVITAVYNGESYIERCIQSVLDQTYPNIEYIVVDGASKDNTLKVVRRYKDRIAHIISEADKGVYYAMNKGIARASGDIIGFLNADDKFMDRDSLAHLIAPFSDPNVMAAYSDMIMFDNYDHQVREWRPGRYNCIKARTGWHPPHPTFYGRAKMMKQDGMFDTRYRIAADIDVMTRILRRYPKQIAYVKKDTVSMLSGGMSNAGFKAIMKGNRECYAAWRKQGDSKLRAGFAVFCKLTRKVLQVIFADLAGTKLR